jgi:carbamoyltransferase
MNILGLSFDYHDSAAALIIDGEVIAASSEERFSRKKNDASFPMQAIQFCLTKSNLTIEDIDFVVFYEDTLLKFDRIFKTSFFNSQKRREYFWPVLKDWIVKNKFFTMEKISSFLSIPSSKIKFVKHHEAHAGSAYFCSPYKEAAIVTLDGVGEYQTMTISKGEGSQVKLLSQCNLPHSIGLFYSAITAYLGFTVNEDEYKVMGMAGYGKPIFYDQIKNLFELKEDGTFKIDQSYFEFSNPVSLPFNKKFEDLLGARRDSSKEFFLAKGKEYSNEHRVNNERFANIAASAQKITEEVIEHVVVSALRMADSKNVCLSGGVALNSLANGIIKRKYDIDMYVQPASGDAGSSIGAALYYYNTKLKSPKRVPFLNPFQGPEYSNEEIQKSIEKAFIKKYTYYENEDDFFHIIADILNQGKVLGWINGRSEFGPRSLGARSILANPLNPDMQYIVNKSIKFREAFRPFAPAVIEEAASKFFELPRISNETDPEYYMLAICKVREEYKSILPSITHVDGTARVQLVSKKTNPRFHKLLSVFGTKSGSPVLLNTSFNLKGEPIVETPLNAIKTFEWSNMDYLAIQNYLVEKSYF